MRVEFRGSVDDYLWDVVARHRRQMAGCSGTLCYQVMTDFLRDPAEMGVSHMVYGVLR
jgi:hypothetical protein